MSDVQRGMVLGFAVAVGLSLIVAVAAWVDHRRAAKHRAAEVVLPNSLDRPDAPRVVDERDALLAGWIADGAPKLPGLDEVVDRAPDVEAGEGSHLARLTPADLDRLAELVEFRRREAALNGHRPPSPRGPSS